MSLLGAIFGNETELQNRIVTLKEGVQAWKNEANRIEKEYSDYINKTSANETEITTLRSQISKLETAGQEQKTENEKQKAEIENLNNEISECDTIIKKLTESENWVCVGKNELEIGYGRTNKEGRRLDGLIIVQTKHLKELPAKTEDGNDIFKDGSSYPCSLMDFIRQDKNKQVHPVKEDLKKYPSIKPFGEYQKKTDEDHDLNRNENKEGPEEELETDEQRNTKDSNEPLSSNQKRIVDYIIKKGQVVSNRIIVADIQMDEATVSKNVKTLIERGILTKRNGYLELEGNST